MSSTFVADATILRKAVADAALARDKRAKLPVLHHVHVRCNGETATFSCTDLALVVSAAIPVTDADAFAICVPVDFLTSALKGAKGEARFTLVNIPASTIQTAVMKTASSETSTLTIPAEEFPLLPELPVANPDMEVGYAATFVRSLAFVRPCMAKDDTRTALNGVHMRAEGEKAVFSSTDGRRAARIVMSAMCADKPDIGTIIPGKAVDAMLKSLGKKPEGRLSFFKPTFSGGFMAAFLSWERRTIAFRPVEEGRFPCIEAIIPQTCTHRIAMNPDQLAETAEACTAWGRANPEGNGFPTFLRVNLAEAREGRLEIKAHSTSGATFSQAIPVAAWLGDKPEPMAFNARYVADMASAFAILGARKIAIMANTPLDMILVADATNPDHGGLHLIMPVRVKD